MEDNFDYGAVPYNFAHCFNDRCPKGEKCLRHLVAVHSTDLHSIISVVNPKCVPEEVNICPFYKPDYHCNNRYVFPKSFGECSSN